MNDIYDIVIEMRGRRRTRSCTEALNAEIIHSFRKSNDVRCTSLFPINFSMFVNISQCCSFFGAFAKVERSEHNWKVPQNLAHFAVYANERKKK